VVTLIVAITGAVRISASGGPSSAQRSASAHRGHDPTNHCCPLLSQSADAHCPNSRTLHLRKAPTKTLNAKPYLTSCHPLHLHTPQSDWRFHKLIDPKFCARPRGWQHSSGQIIASYLRKWISPSPPRTTFGWSLRYCNTWRWASPRTHAPSGFCPHGSRWYNQHYEAHARHSSSSAAALHGWWRWMSLSSFHSEQWIPIMQSCRAAKS